ncbi:hypothetical protein B0T20DRAFT_399233 [Sordaria brevicollis]|uniref:Uncharacterized protein n=1 Tax=Sordaria brevicollis TaxID=83679 RepID=A0AAE0PN63_SORBR|nr:hypothetical protein B0T20DRAFT_399233 [Sordaria brevicollis]
MRPRIQKCCTTAPYITRRSLHQTSLLRSSSQNNNDSNNEPPPPASSPPSKHDYYSEDYDIDPSDFFASRPYQIDPSQKAVHTKTGHTLPLSPFMDPTYHSSRNRWKQPKPTSRPAGRRVTKFDQLLESNPFALALAEPLRMCTATELVLPKPCLQKFNLLRHPETDEPWFVPADLAPHDALDPAKQRDQALGPSGYTLSNQTLLHAFVEKGSNYFGLNRKLLRRNAMNKTGLGEVLNKAVWRQDMDTLILKLMRRRIVDELLYLTDKCTGSLRRKYLTPLGGGYEEARERKLRGCLLYVGGGGGPGFGGEGQGVMKPPQRVSTLEIKSEKYSTKLPVYDFTVLLGEEELRRLREGEETGFWRQTQLFALGREATIGLQMKLWKLEGYMARDEQSGHGNQAKTAEIKVEERKQVLSSGGYGGQRDAPRAQARPDEIRRPGGGDRPPGWWQPGGSSFL